MKDKINKNLSSLQKNNSNTNSNVKNEKSNLIPNKKISNIVKKKINDNYESQIIQKRFDFYTPIKINKVKKVKNKIFQSFKLKQFNSTIFFNNVKKCRNNSKNSKNEMSVSRTSKKIVVMKIIRTRTNSINNSSNLNSENRFSVTHNSTKPNRNLEDFDNDTQTKFFTVSQKFLNNNYISTSKLDIPRNKSNEDNIEEKNRITRSNRIDRKKGFSFQEIRSYNNK